eukprot:TRINITY_DN21374_c0_g1_i4.p1 TRINITY_DN21374_c0_g1~~TRINITY_DN21374_c0_g1_i4.p1  ORF type:complete len:289 (+),score=50.92 TRINITY_DN21374_c0_g1_i4:63-929(+)
MSVLRRAANVLFDTQNVALFDLAPTANRLCTSRSKRTQFFLPLTRKFCQGPRSNRLVSMASNPQASQVNDGYPSGSLVDFSFGDDACPILAISSLAVHHKDLLANPRCSLLTTKDASDRSDTVVTLYGDAVFVPENERDVCRASYLRNHPGAFWVDFGDFQFVRIEPKKVRYVSGIATAMLRSEEFNSDEFKAAKVDPMAQFSVPVASHMNKDHSEDTKLIVQHCTDIEVDHAEMIDLDSMGFNVKVSYHGNMARLRIPFPRVAKDRRDVKSLIVEMLDVAKQEMLSS